MIHLSDDTLNELLDNALPPARRDEALAHLAGCPACAARRDALHALFADLDSFPDLPLEIDLASRVLAHLEQPVRLPGALRWLAWAQGLAALLALALAWPLLAALTPGLNIPALTPAWVDMTTRLSVDWLDLINRLSTDHFQRFDWLNAGSSTLASDLPALTLASLATCALLLWLVGNAFLLKPHSRRTL
jgi:hypothetical protein